MDGNDSLRHTLLPRNDTDAQHPSTDDLGGACYSFRSRYLRLKRPSLPWRLLPGSHDVDGQQNAMSDGEFTSTTRTLVEDLCYSGELPVPGGVPHLKTETQRRLKISRPTGSVISTLGGDRTTPFFDSIELGESWENYLQTQNEEWFQTAWMTTRPGKADIRYECSSESSDEESMPVKESPFRRRRITDQHPAVSAQASSSVGHQRNSDDRLVELARTGQFSELLEALKTSRKEAAMNNTASTVYFSAVDTILSDLTVDTAQKCVHERKHSFSTALEHSVGESFQTCDPWYSEDSCIFPFDGGRSNTGSHAWPDVEERQQTLRRLILERAQRVEEREQRRKRIIVVTKIPKNGSDQQSSTSSRTNK